ncbi:transport protein Avl9-domain-containing protein [Hysterangium stoloniferum]|nr:transport protein Avl9-domain-containing protein [Hysterangium stoloniferum]
MSALESIEPSQHESSDDHSHFFSNSDDDAETASQRSIPLDSAPSSPKKVINFAAATKPLKTPVTGSFSQKFSPLSPTSPKEHSFARSSAASPEHPKSDTDLETNSTVETGTSGPSSVFKFEEGGTRPSSMSSNTSFFAHNAADKDSGMHKITLSPILAPTPDVSYPSPPQTSPDGLDGSELDYDSNRRATMSSLGSAVTNSSSASGRKTRPESMLLEPTDGPLVLGIALVDFNHIVGPRIEFFEGDVFQDEDLVRILPFLALPDGAHLALEDYSYFHLVPSGPKPTTLFGISCNRQIPSADLISKGDDVTRSTVQKAVVVLASKPVFGAMRDKLGVVTNAFFDQRDFRETAILTDFLSTLEVSLRSQLTESGLYMGTSLRELVHKFRHRTLILLKALILQKKIMFYGHPVERLCTYQYSLITLIPMLLQNLQDCGSPPLAARALTLSRPTSLRTSDRRSLLTYAGLPLDIFGKDAFFQPYLPLQQIDIAKETNSWLCGCTNSIVYTQSGYDLLVNIETNAFEYKDSKFEKLMALTAADRKWIDDIVKDVNDGWNEDDPTRPAGMQFKGSDDYLRTKFEEYISAAMATVKYSGFLAKGESKGILISEGYDPVCQQDFGPAWLAGFKATHAFEVWDRITDPMVFDIVEPRHPCIDKPSTVTDIGLQLSETIRDLKIEQQLAPTREAISNAFTTGSTNFFKAVDGLKDRWNQRSASSSSVATASSSSASLATSTEPKDTTTAPESPEADPEPTPVPVLATPTSPSRPPSVIAAQVTSDAKATLGAWGTGLGSFFTNRRARFSISRSSSSTSLPMTTPPPAVTVDALPENIDDKGEKTPTPTSNEHAEDSEAGVNVPHAL